MIRLALTAFVAFTLTAQQPNPTSSTKETPPVAPQTVPERTDHKETSRAADVAGFLAGLSTLPHYDRLQVTVAGKSHEGREQQLVRVALPDVRKDAIRALVIANIHAGEVEGKEAVQVLLREFAQGEHEALLQKCVLWFLPIYNIDGNERIDAKSRPEQNGPDAVGQRANAKGLDLNRDFVKSEAPETRTLLRLMNELDPHLFFDLHTTDGSWHGYHLTYAPSLSPNMDRDLARLSRELLDATTASLQPKFATFDYGNFETHDWDGSGAPESQQGVRGYWSYDHRARYCVNGFGLRNRIGILSEAYSNADFATRIAATRAFVLSVLTAAAARDDAVRAACAAADRRLTTPEAPVYFGFDTVFGDPETMSLSIGDCDKLELPDSLGKRFIRKADTKNETMPVFRRFRSRQQIALPIAWAIPAPFAGVQEQLERHGVRCEVLTTERTTATATFTIKQKRKPKRPFQGHQELQLEGTWAKATSATLQAGTLFIDAHQPLARVAAQLLEPQSEDSLSTWNFLEAMTIDLYPVLRIAQRP
ncbi:MAG: M14 family metallopeptidase [Planctomycetota bacterium]|nr:M14 family metallopeptidase [Planctomycetota bacterium]